MAIKKLSIKTEKILKFLQEWHSESHLYELQQFHSTDIYTELEEESFLKDEFDVDLTQYFKDTFTAFATEGGAEYSVFWTYPELEGEPPIVTWSSVGGEPRFLAGSLNDLVSKMIHNIGFYGGWHEQGDNQPLTEDFENVYYDISYDYNRDNKKKISEEEVKNIIEKERQEFKERALKVIDFISEEEIEANIKKHPCFLTRRQQFDIKSYEVYFLGREIKNEEEFLKLLSYLEKEIRSEYSDYSKEYVTLALKENYPNYCVLYSFQKWLKALEQPKKEPTEEEKEIASKIANYISQYDEEKNNSDFVQGFKEKHPEIYEIETYKNYIDQMASFMNSTKDVSNLYEAIEVAVKQKKERMTLDDGKK